MKFVIQNPSVNEKTILEILDARDDNYAARLYRQVIFLITNTHYIDEEMLIKDYFNMLRLGLHLNFESIYFTNVSFLSFLERKLKKYVDEENDIFYKEFTDTLTYIDELIEKENNPTSIVNLKQFKTRLISVFRKHHIKFINN